MVTLFKKGVVSRGKLGFLNSSKLVEVLSTTYIAPKKSMILVKAYNQVFLVGSTDNSLNLIAEVKDVPGLIKEGEKTITGNNFDTTVDDVDSLNDLESKVKLKQDNEIFESASDKKERFSDQIKRKVKGLRPLQ
ncbi:MAG: flagellar biosynthetic protein FliO [Bacteriovoracaceae bacterium]